MEPTVPGSGTVTATTHTTAAKPPTTHATTNPETILANNRATAQETANIGNAGNQAYQNTGYGNTNNS